jgi:ligand-binding sensor domain-containing protein
LPVDIDIKLVIFSIIRSGNCKVLMNTASFFKDIWKSWRILAAMISLYFLYSPALLAQKDNIQFSHLSVDEGLSQSTVFSIAKDQAGFMWFGTRDGLNKYDSRRIKIYKNDPRDSTSLSNNAVMSLLTDASGQLWIGTGLGLNRYDPGQDSFRRVHFKFDPAFSIPGNHILALFEDRAHNIWVGTREGG